MSALTVRIPEKTVDEIARRSKKLHITRSEYIRKSIENMNKHLAEQERRDKIMRISKKVSANSMAINAEFEKIEGDVED